MAQYNTPFGSRCVILSDLWLNYKEDITFRDFIQYNDLGLPLAFVISEDIVETTPMAEQYINEAWELFVDGLEIEDTGFDTLDQMLDLAKE